MRIILFLFFLFVSVPAFAQMPEDWKYCTEDDDCRIIGGECFLDAVNQEHITQGTQYANDINARIECVRYMDPLRAVALCDKPPQPCPPGASCPDVMGRCKAVEE
ncbi:MAG: hypothetical protein KDI65_12630 [Alphaproteobacteria bacterium]|nr:hypothetical protein [Alphaproteobacteria bacterium]